MFQYNQGRLKYCEGHYRGPYIYKRHKPKDEIFNYIYALRNFFRDIFSALKMLFELIILDLQTFRAPINCGP